MPNRWIRESAKTSKNLNEISDFAERLFWRLITTADDHGRFLACGSIVRAACFPLMDRLSLERVDKALGELVRHQLIDLYAVGDRRYGHFRKWEEHQGPPRAMKSKYPEPPAMTSEGNHAFSSLPVNSCAQMQTTVHSCEQLRTNVPVSESESESVQRERERVGSASVVALPLPPHPDGSDQGKRTRRKPAGNPVPLPPDFAFTPEMRTWALDEGCAEPFVEFEQFCDKARAKGWTYIDWQAAWKNWVRNEIKWRKERAHA